MKIVFTLMVFLMGQAAFAQTGFIGDDESTRPVAKPGVVKPVVPPAIVKAADEASPYQCAKGKWTDEVEASMELFDQALGMDKTLPFMVSGDVPVNKVRPKVQLEKNGRKVAMTVQFMHNTIIGPQMVTVAASVRLCQSSSTTLRIQAQSSEHGAFEFTLTKRNAAQFHLSLQDREKGVNFNSTFSATAGAIR